MKKSNMQKTAIKDLAYGGMMELLGNSRYYYRSGVGQSYSHLTEDGKAAVVEFMDMIAWKMLEAEDRDLDTRAKKQVMDSLKKD